MWNRTARPSFPETIVFNQTTEIVKNGVFVKDNCSHGSITRNKDTNLCVPNAMHDMDKVLREAKKGESAKY